MSKLNELAIAAGKGDRSAMQELAGQLQAPVWRFAYSLTHSRELADEAAQETWVRAIRSLRGFKGESEVTTWILTIARRVVAGLLENKKRAAVSAEEFFTAGPSSLPDLAIELGRLPQALREPLVLTQVVGLSYQETANVIGIKIGTVRSRVFRARAQLTTALLDDSKEDVDGM